MMASQKHSGSEIQQLQVPSPRSQYLKSTSDPSHPEDILMFSILIRVCWATRVAKIKPEESPVPTWHWYEFKNTSTSSSRGCPECKRTNGEPSPSKVPNIGISNVGPFICTYTSVHNRPLVHRSNPQVWGMISITCGYKNIYIYTFVCDIYIIYIYIYIYIVYIYISFVLVQVIPFPPKKNRGFCWNPYKWLSTWVFSLCMTWNFFHFPQGLWHPKNFDLGHVFSHPAHSTGRPIWGSHPPAPVVVHRPASRWVFPWQSHQVARSKTCPTMAFHSIVGESWPYHHCIRSHPHNLVDVGWCGCDCWWICWVDLFFWKEVF